MDKQIKIYLFCHNYRLWIVYKVKGVDANMEQEERLSPMPEKMGPEAVMQTYSNTLFKLCFAMLRNNADAEDAVSEVLLKYMTTQRQFASAEHLKAWLIRVATNVCKDLLRFYKIRNHIDLDEIAEYCKAEEDTQIVAELLRLPEKYRTVIYLYYIEGYRTAEIAEILSISSGAVRKRLQYGRDALRLEYEKDVFRPIQGKDVLT